MILFQHESELAVGDRLGFACSFLPDAKLISFVQELSSDMLKKGNLDGILLTGMTLESIPLLQRYLNITADIQSVALLAMRTMASEIVSSPSLKLYIERYRDLLDSWKLWEERAEFDILKNRNNPALIQQPEVTVSCNFCGKSITASGVTGQSRSNQMFSRFVTTDVKLKVIIIMKQSIRVISVLIYNTTLLHYSKPHVAQAVGSLFPGAQSACCIWELFLEVERSNPL